MKKAVLIAVWGISVCMAVACGMKVGRARVPRSVPTTAPAMVKQQGEAPSPSNLVAQIDEVREAIRVKEIKVQRLRQEMDAVKSQMRPPLSPELEKELKERLQRRKDDEARATEEDRGDVLRRKIVQRKDKALREMGLAELMAVLGSGNPDDRETGLAVLRGLGAIPFDKEKFRPYVVAALSDERASIRRQAVECLGMVCPYEETMEIAARMAKDADRDVRLWAAFQLNGSSAPEHKALGASALRSVLLEGDREVRRLILHTFRPLPEELDDVVVRLLGEEEHQSILAQKLHDDRQTIGAPIVRRLAEMYDEGTSPETIMMFLDPGRVHVGDAKDPERRQGQPCLSEEVKPVVRDIYLRTIRDSLSRGTRWQALEGLRELGDASVIPYLDEIARSEEAEGIEKELAETIERLRQSESQQR